MDCEFDEKKFRQYFHYGLVYDKNDLLDAIIMQSAKNEYSQDRNNRSIDLLKNEVDKSKALYLQFKRFIELTGWYKKTIKEQVESDVVQRIEELHKSRMISVVTYMPARGIYVNDRGFQGDYTGVQRYEDIPVWIKDDVLPILNYLQKLENENPYQYCSLFVDTMYARDINCNQGTKKETIKAFYTTFMEMVKPAMADVKELFDGKMSREQEKYIEENCAHYWTLTDLKQQSKTERYEKKVRSCYERLKELESRQEYKEEEKGRENM